MGCVRAIRTTFGAMLCLLRVPRRASQHWYIAHPLGLHPINMHYRHHTILYLRKTLFTSVAPLNRFIICTCIAVSRNHSPLLRSHPISPVAARCTGNSAADVGQPHRGEHRRHRVRPRRCVRRSRLVSDARYPSTMSSSTCNSSCGSILSISSCCSSYQATVASSAPTPPSLRNRTTQNTFAGTSPTLNPTHVRP